MRLKSRSTAIAALALFAPALPSLAQTNYVHLFGGPAPLSAATRTIVIEPDTRHVNVKEGDIVKFVVDDKAFAWNFNVASTVHRFELNQVAPADVALDHPVIAYIQPDPGRG
jgi:hypothetical protein